MQKHKTDTKTVAMTRGKTPHTLPQRANGQGSICGCCPLHLPGEGALANQGEAGVSDLILTVMTEQPLNAQSAL